MDPYTLAKEITARLRAAGHTAWLVGGCVRDLLLGAAPKDYDVATSAQPAQVRELFPGSGEVGAHFGVALVRRGGATVEVATFRADGEYPDGRHPAEVHFVGSAEADAQRRDFTINGLFLDPFTGETLDFVGGRADLQAGLIRAIGAPEARFAEDHLRMLRAIRFAARLGFTIEPATFAAIQTHAAQIARIAPERVRDELVRILIEGGARRGMELLDASGLLPRILPEVAALKGVQQPPEFHPEGDVWTHTLLLLEGLRNPTPTLALAALLHDVGKPAAFRVEGRIRFHGHAESGAAMARDILQRLRFSADETTRVCAMVAGHMQFRNAARMRESTLKRFLRAPHFSELLELHRLDAGAGNGNLDDYGFVLDKLNAMPPEALHPTPLINGRDLMAAGFTPGPGFARALQAVEDAQLEGSVRTRQQALELALRLLRTAPPEG